MKLFVHATGLLATTLLGACVAILSILPIDMDKWPGAFLQVAIMLAVVVAVLSVLIVRFDD